MAFGVKSGKLLTTNDGIPYMWESYNTDGATSVTTITSSDAASSDDFGASIAIGTSKIVIGAHDDDDNGSSSGSVYVYNLDGTGEIKITPSDGTADASFGNSVDIDEKSGKIVVGSWRHDGSGSGVVQSIGGHGRAYIYDLDGTNEVILAPSELGGANSSRYGDKFGQRVRVHNNKVYVTAPYYGGSERGTLFVFNKDGTNKQLYTAPVERTNGYFTAGFEIGTEKIVIGQNTGSNEKIHIFDMNMNFIKSFLVDDEMNPIGDEWLAVGSGRIVIGQYVDDDAGNNAGAVLIYNIDGQFINKIYSPRPTVSGPFGLFGHSVSVDCGKIFVAADENENPGNGNFIYIYDLDGNYISSINEGSSYPNLGVGTDWGQLVYKHGKLAIGHNSTNEVLLYDCPPMYTPFDARDLEKGRK